MGNLFTKAEQLEVKIAELQEKEMSSGILMEELQLLRNHNAEYHSVLRLQEMLWRQKFRIQWLLVGDSNSILLPSCICA